MNFPMSTLKHNGFAISLAWPETLCKKTGAWYDYLMHILGISKNNYYRVGHAAVILIHEKNGDCHYFDFGRYHAPNGHGRVRNKGTDFDLEIPIRAKIEDGTIRNLREIFQYVEKNKSCHGTGNLIGSYCPIDFKKAYIKAISMQQKGAIEYGPFIWNGTNCSRFVRTVILFGKPSFRFWYRLFIPLTFTPTPAWNVVALKSYHSNQLEQKNDIYSYSKIEKYPC
ncbi:hypothetical protein [Aquirufa beregesia]